MEATGQVAQLVEHRTEKATGGSAKHLVFKARSGVGRFSETRSKPPKESVPDSMRV
jgi:hypothetical protein